MRITPEECAELLNNLPLRLVIHDAPDNNNKVLTVFDHGRVTYGRRLLHKDAKAIIALPAILDLVAEQRQEIKELKDFLIKIRDKTGKEFMGKDAIKAWVEGTADD